MEHQFFHIVSILHRYCDHTVNPALQKGQEEASKSAAAKIGLDIFLLVILKCLPGHMLKIFVKP